MRKFAKWLKAILPPLVVCVKVGHDFHSFFLFHLFNTLVVVKIDPFGQVLVSSTSEHQFGGAVTCIYAVGSIAVDLCKCIFF